MAEQKQGEEEKRCRKLKEIQKRVKNLRIKYESFVQKNQSSKYKQVNQNIEEHTQAYYIIKSSQEIEKLQRKGDELNAEIFKKNLELKALDNTLIPLKIEIGISQKEVSHKDGLKEQCRAASEILNRIEIFDNQEREVDMQLQKIEKNYKINKKRQIEIKIQQKRIVLDESNAHLCFGLDIFNNLNKTLEACTLNHFRFYSSNIKLGQEFPEIQATIDAVFQEKNVNVSIKQPSSFGVPSVRSSVSSASSQGRRRLRSYQQVIKQKIYNFYQLYLKSIFQMNVLQ